MKYSTSWLLQEIARESHIKYLHFWGHQPSPNGNVSASCFSQWWNGHRFTENKVVYPTAEHYMMAGKAKLFGDNEHLTKILQCKSPAEAKKLGRMVRNFDPATWEQHRCEIVIKGNYLKFSQHPDIQEFLLNTQNRVIVEASPRDRIWGIGMGRYNENVERPENWRGQNLLGFCLMEVRDRLEEKR